MLSGPIELFLWKYYASL